MDKKVQPYGWVKKITQPLTFLSLSCIFCNQFEQEYIIKGILAMKFEEEKTKYRVGALSCLFDQFWNKLSDLLVGGPFCIVWVALNWKTTVVHAAGQFLCQDSAEDEHEEQDESKEEDDGDEDEDHGGVHL